jgi:hypothetical protein
MLSLREVSRMSKASVEGGRLAAECAKLDPKFERSLADEGSGVDSAAWPEF